MSQESRRIVLKGLAISLPATWATPLVESVILPAHAGTSIDCEFFQSEEEAIKAVCSDLDVRTNQEDCNECSKRLKECGSGFNVGCCCVG